MNLREWQCKYHTIMDFSAVSTFLFSKTIPSKYGSCTLICTNLAHTLTMCAKKLTRLYVLSKRGKVQPMISITKSITLCTFAELYMLDKQSSPFLCNICVHVNQFVRPKEDARWNDNEDSTQKPYNPLDIREVPSCEKISPCTKIKNFV